MRNALATLLSAAILAGCDTNAQQPGAEPVWRITPEGVSLHVGGARQHALVRLPGWLWADEPYSCPPYVATGPKGEALVTSNVVPTLWRIDPVSLAVTVHPVRLNADQDKDVGFTGLVFSPQHGAFYALSDTYGSVWRIDPNLASATKVASGPAHPRSAPCGDVGSRLSLGG